MSSLPVGLADRYCAGPYAPGATASITVARGARPADDMRLAARRPRDPLDRDGRAGRANLSAPAGACYSPVR